MSTTEDMEGSNSLMLRIVDSASEITDRAELAGQSRISPRVNTASGLGTQDGNRDSTNTFPSPSTNDPNTYNHRNTYELGPLGDPAPPLNIEADNSSSQASDTQGIAIEDIPPLNDHHPAETASNHKRKRRYLSPSFLNRAHWGYLLAAVMTLILVAVIITLSVELSRSRDHGTTTTANFTLQDIVSPAADVPPVADSPIDATEVIFATYYGIASDKPQAKLAYLSAGGKICVRTKLQGTWLGNVHCVVNANPKNNTSLTILDWASGPSVYFITADNMLSGMDHVPANNTWVLSPLAKQNVAVHPQSRIASVTWLNGSSTWIYFQDSNGQMREYGLDDGRDQVWREGSNGPLGIAANGSFFSATRYMIGADEFEEVVFEAGSNILHGRRYAYSVWESSLYAVDGTAGGLAATAPFSLTTIANSNTSNPLIMIAYMTSDGFFTTQTRGTANITDLGAFNKPVKAAQSDGYAAAALVADGSSGKPKLYVMYKDKILEYSADAMAMNWTAATDITN